MELNGTEDIRVDGKPVAAQSPVIYIALNKPAGYISDRGVSDARSALDLVEAGARLFPVGRLDIDATGLLLLTNDGELAYTLTHPKYEHEKEYRVLVDGVPSDHALSQWRQGVLLDGDTRPTAPAKVKQIDGPDVPGATWLAVRLRGTQAPDQARRAGGRSPCA
jgi:pseudouridine synthase